MFRSRYPVLLTLALAGAGLAWGQDYSAAPKYQDRVGKIITVQEATRQGERCQIAQAWELADGNIAMLARSLTTGLTVTVVEQVRSNANDRFLVYRWTADGLPPTGCPMPAGGVSTGLAKASPPAPQHVMPTAAPHYPSAGVVQAQMPAPSAPIVQSKPAPSAPIVQSKPAPVPEAPRTIVQAPSAPVVQPPAAPIVQAPAAPAPARPAVTGPAMESKPPALKAEPPRFLVDAKPIEATPLPAAPKPQAATASPVQPASVRASTGTSSVVQAKPITTEMPKIIVQGEPQVVQPERLPPPKSEAVQPAPKVVTDMTYTGRMINVTEKGKAPDQCIVLESCLMPDGTETMKAQSICTGEVMTIVCACKQPKLSFFERFRQAKCNGREVCCEPCPPKAWGPATTYEPKKATAGDPLLPQVAKKEEPKVVEKPKEEPKLPAVNPKDVAPAPLPPKVADARPIEKPEKGVMVPVPLVPLATTEDKPNVPPPQPVVRPFETMESKAVTTYEAEPKAPMAPPSAQAMKSPSMKSPSVVQASNKPAAPSNAYQPKMPVCEPGPVGTTGWTAGPFRPATEIPPAIQGVQRASFDQNPTEAQNTVYLMTVLQSSGTPAQREWAAKKLCVCDARSTPYVVDALMTAAKSDSAALVRVACIQTLVKLQAKNTAVLGMLQQAKLDKDPRVADEAMVALTVLSDTKPALQQVGGKVKK